MSVSYTRPEVTAMLSKWSQICDCISGQERIKAQGVTYLPDPCPSATGTEHTARYAQYLKRAVFYNVTHRTLDGLVGQVFLRDPEMQLPSGLKTLEVDADGSGVGLNQQAKKTLSTVLALGRCGLLVDYPAVDGPLSVEQVNAGYVKPTISLYDPKSIINWRTTMVGSKKKLSLLVIAEDEVLDDDGFELRTGLTWRVLRLVDGRYTAEFYRVVDGSLASDGIIYPTDSTGRPFTEIPFTFVGSLNNDPSIDHPPLYDLSVLNIAHYLNSADYEESAHMVGQPTLFISGINEQWAKNVWEGKRITIGSRATVVVPSGADGKLLQAAPNTLPMEAMQAKERQMVAIGAKLVENIKTVRTFGEAQLDEASETSVLGTAAHNVSRAYRDALAWCALYTGDTGEAVYELNTDFPAARMSPQERQQLMAEWSGGAISFSEMRRTLRTAGIATLEDEEAKSEIESEPRGPAIGIVSPAAEEAPDEEVTE